MKCCLLLLTLILLNPSFYSQTGPIDHIVPLNVKFGSQEIDQVILRQIMEEWHRLEKSKSIELQLLMRSERALSQKDMELLSFRRANDIYDSLQGTVIPLDKILLKKNSFEDASVGLCPMVHPDKKVTKPKGYYSMILTKPEWYVDRDDTPDLQSGNCNEYWITNLGDCLIRGPKGTQVHFPAGSFPINYAKQERPEARIKITMCEYYTRGDFIEASLSTTSQGRQLESGGTIYLSAEFQGRPIDLAPDKTIEILFPLKDCVALNMKAFYGSWEEGTVDWLEDEESFMGMNGGNSEFDRPLTSGLEDAENPFNIESFADGETSLYRRDADYFDAAGYFMQSNRLGWINCDRFYDRSEEKIPLLVTNERNAPMRYSLVYHDIRSVLDGSIQSPSRTRFDNAFKGDKVTIVGTSNTTDGRVVLAMKTILVNEQDNFQTLPVRIISKEEFKQIVDTSPLFR